MAEVQHGYLMLADISGHTEYLGEVELEHCHDVVAKLLGVVGEQGMRRLRDYAEYSSKGVT